MGGSARTSNAGSVRTSNTGDGDGRSSPHAPHKSKAGFTRELLAQSRDNGEPAFHEKGESTKKMTIKKTIQCHAIESPCNDHHTHCD